MKRIAGVALLAYLLPTLLPWGAAVVHDGFHLVDQFEALDLFRGEEHSGDEHHEHGDGVHVHGNGGVAHSHTGLVDALLALRLGDRVMDESPGLELNSDTGVHLPALAASFDPDPRNVVSPTDILRPAFEIPSRVIEPPPPRA